jgi:RHS repeat-associated protein
MNRTTIIRRRLPGGKSTMTRFRTTVVLARVCALAATLFAFLVVTPAPASAAVSERSVYYSYDLMGRQLSAKFDSATGSDGATNSYNGFGELTSTTLSMGTFSKTLTSTYDGAGRRTQVTHPDGQAFTYGYDTLSRLTNLYEGAGTATPLDSFTYTNAGLVNNRNEGSTGTSSATYGWDAIGRLTSQSDAFSSNINNVGWTFGLNPASQIISEARSSDAYVYGGLVSVNRTYAVNGLNQYTSAGPASFTYDDNGNLTSDGTNSYTYDVENRLVQAVNGGVATNLTYDPSGRLFEVAKGSADTRFLYDGDALVAEYDGSGTLTNRYVHGSNAAADDPLVWYVGAGLTSRHFLHADHLGSIVAVTNSSGAPSINSYDEYGIPSAINSGRFQYTGQAWLSELGMYYYKARIYSPTLGRFLQTDPIGYDDQINQYEYVGDDPLNATDPTGRLSCPSASENTSACNDSPDHTFRDRMAIAGAGVGAIVGGVGGGTVGGAAGAAAGTACGPGAVACSPAGAIAGAAEGVTVGAAGGAVIVGGAGAVVGDLIDKGIALFNKATGGDRGGDRQFNGRPDSNTTQNRQVTDAARQAGLKAGQRRELGRAVEAESRQGGANLGYHDILEIARAIKSGTY